MSEKWRKQDYYPSLLFFLISMSVLCYCIYRYHFNIIAPILCLPVLLISILYQAVRRTKKQWLLILVFTSFLVLIMEIKKDKKLSFKENHSNFFDKLLQQKTQEAVFSYGEITLLLLALVILSILLCDLLMLTFQIRVLFVVVFLLLICYAIVFHDFFNKGTLAFGFTFCLTILLEGIQVIEDKKVKRTDDSIKRTRTVFFCAPFLLTFTLLLLCLPQKDKPYQWAFVRKAVKYCVQETITAYQQVSGLLYSLSDGLDIQTSGYSERGGLGNGLTNSNDVVMNLILKDKSMQSIYLSGKYFSDFDDMEWSAKKETEEIRQLSLLPGDETEEFHYALGRFGVGNTTEYLHESRCEVTFYNIHTKTVFHPMMTTRILEGKEVLELKKVYNQLLFKRSRGYGTKYILEYKEPDLSADEVVNMIRQEGTYPYTDKTRYERSLRDKANAIKSIYGKTPELSSQVKAYIDEITLPYDNDYDKLKAVEEVLSSYQYTTEQVNLDREYFMDDFLLNKKEGYCTYYATAFALISRYLGLPSRYVQGYVVSFDGKRKVDVLERNAHAWPEVYFEGVGWIPFEPTPTFSPQRYVTYAKKVNQSVMDYSQQYAYQNQNVQQELDKEMLLNKLNEEESIPVIKIVFGVCFVFIFILGTYIVGSIMKKRKYKKMNDIDKVGYILQMVILFLSFIGLQMLEGETLQEFFDRNTDDKLNDRLKEILSIYQEVRYKQVSPTRQQIALMRENANEVYLIILRKIKKKAIVLRFMVFDFSFSKTKRNIL